jgi:hypothetical protein
VTNQPWSLQSSFGLRAPWRREVETQGDAFCYAFA